MIRKLKDIVPEPTSHGAGMKRVLVSSSESGCSITQIAVTELRCGEVATAHVHPDMQEGFYVLDGELSVSLNGKETVCRKDTFVYVEKCTSHEMKALTDTRILTVGCVIEASRNKLYPMLFKRNVKTLVWGTEDWAVSGIEGSESVVENGTWANYSLNDVISRRPAEILGKKTARDYNGKLPLLAKIIDASQDLSIQVHPDNEMAERVHHKMGKSEMWYILDAEPGAFLYAGLKKHITPEEYRQRVQDGTICEVLCRHYVSKGDVFYLPAGRIHAICGGIRLAEIQQSSDLTYRIYDYNRPGLDGKLRELHTDLASQAIDYTVYPEYRTESRNESYTASELLNTPFFSVNIVETAFRYRRDMIKYDSFVILVNLAGDCKVTVRSTGDVIPLAAGASCLIPAVVADYYITPASFAEDGIVRPAKVLEAFINNHKTIGRMISDFFSAKRG
ncbi:MAG: cupin domain-containing protein [Bacteroidaceae bacterium]|nr:cupin domain-containing protein [Bacteroidaceae bacterium]